MTKKKNSPAKEADTLGISLYAVAGFGVLLTIITELSHHYPIIMELCGGETSGCADVASTSYAKMFGVSVAYWGLLSYVVFLFTLFYRPVFILPLASALMGAELYFLWIMSSVIQVYCLFCLIQFAAVTVLFALAIAWSLRHGEYFLPGRLLSAPVVALVAFIALAAPVKMQSSEAPVGAGDLVTYRGPADSKIRFELYSDYQCGHCRNLEPEIDKLIANHPDVLLVFRDYVLRSNELSPVAASYANGVAFTKGSEEFVKTRTEMFHNQDRLYDYLKKRLDTVKFDDELKTKIREKVQADMKRAESLGIFATPSMVIYKDDQIVQVIKGFAPYDKFSRFLKS